MACIRIRPRIILLVITVISSKCWGKQQPILMLAAHTEYRDISYHTYMRTNHRGRISLFFCDNQLFTSKVYSFASSLEHEFGFEVREDRFLKGNIGWPRLHTAWELEIVVEQQVRKH